MGNFSTGQNSAYQIDKIFQQLNSPHHHNHHHPHKHHFKNRHHKIFTQDDISYSGFTTSQGNIIWTPVLTVSYSDFRTLIIHNDNLTLTQNSSLESQKLIKALNESTINKKDIADSQTYIRNGTQQVHIYHTHLKKFPSKTFYDIKNESSQVNNVIIYGCLVKSFVFKSDLSAHQKLEWFQSGNDKGYNASHLIDAIRFTAPESLNQIKIIPDLEWNSFFVGFKASQLLQINQKENAHKDLDAEKADIIYILSAGSPLTKNLSIESIINKVMKIQVQKPIEERQASKNLTKFTMPVIKIDSTYDYNTLGKADLQNAEVCGKKLKLIEQVEISMESNVQSRKEGEDLMVSEQESGQLKRFQIEINSGFWLIVCREGKVPYLVAKINSIE